MNKASKSLLLIAFLITALSSNAYALRIDRTAQKAICGRVVNLKPLSPTSRGGAIIYKSNWNTAARREQTYGEGNHSQKGAAILIYYRSGYVTRSQTLKVYNARGTAVGTLGRYPRCTNQGCGEHERWYFRGVGGSKDSIPSVAAKLKAAGSTNMFVSLNNGICIRVNNPYNNREQA